MTAPSHAVRTDGTAQPPAGLRVPPARMALVHDRCLRKSWRYVGLYTQELMLCAGRVRIGPAPQAFWAVWDRPAGRLHERTTFSPRSVSLPDGRVVVRTREVQADITLDPFGDAVQVVSPHGRSWIWTRKQVAHARGTVTIAGRSRDVAGVALIDDSAGYYARETDWEWSAGVGELTDGRGVVWNLVTGINDRPEAGENAVWVDGASRAVGGATFAPALDGVAVAGGALQFQGESVRERHDHLGLIHSDYIQPFGTFSGELADLGPVRNAFGVMERHHARW